MTPPEPLTMSVEQAAKLLGVGRSAAYADVRATGRLAGIEVIRCGRRILVPRLRFERALGLEKGDGRQVTAADRETQPDRKEDS
jgi:Helix-turn-helix domain